MPADKRNDRVVTTPRFWRHDKMWSWSTDICLASPHKITPIWTGQGAQEFFISLLGKTHPPMGLLLIFIKIEHHFLA
jgi:hypothetical protein